MKTLLITAAALGLLAAGPAALAQDHHPQGRHPQGGGGHPGGGHPQGGHPQGGGHPQSHSQGGARPHGGAPAGGHHGGQPGRPGGGGAPHAPPANHGAPANHGHGGGHSAPNAGRPAGAPARPANIQHYQRNVQASHHYHAGAYRPPSGYAYRRWSYGQRLPGAYYARNFWITNFLAYSLFAPPPGLVWVRYGPDALLIDQYSGEIIQVRYGVFY